MPPPPSSTVGVNRTPTPPSFRSQAHMREMAAALLPRALARAGRDAWIERRTDRISLVDENRILRDIKLEFTLEEVPSPHAATTLAQIPVPLMLRSKDVMSGVEVVDEEGRSLSVLTMSRDRAIVSLLLTTLAGALLSQATNEQLSKEARAALHDIVGDVADARRALAFLEQNEQGKVLLSFPLVASLIRDLVSNFLLIVLVDNKIGVQRTIRVRFDEWLSRGPRDRHRHTTMADSAIGSGVADDFAMALPISAARSFHAEVFAPPSLRFRDAPVSWYFAADGQSGRPRHHSQNHGQQWVIWASGSSAGSVAAVPVDLRCAPGDVTRTAVRITSATAAMFVVPLFATVVLGLHHNGDSAAVLVAVPAIYGLVAVRPPGDHPLTAKRINGPRWTILLAGSIAFAGSGTLAATFPAAPDWLNTLGLGYRALAWFLLGVTALVLSIVTAICSRWLW